MSPFILCFTIFRVLALSTCRDPVWPDAVEAVSAIEPGDIYNQPRGDTPVGWVQTAIARQSDDWPMDPKRAAAGWHGEPDAATNALLWTEELPPAACRQGV